MIFRTVCGSWSHDNVWVVAEQTYLFPAYVPAAGVEDYRTLIAQVVPLVEASGGRVDRRLASDDETVEIFVVSFPRL
jgi:hypothetical protein